MGSGYSGVLDRLYSSCLHLGAKQGDRRGIHQKSIGLYSYSWSGRSHIRHAGAIFSGEDVILRDSKQIRITGFGDGFIGA